MRNAKCVTPNESAHKMGDQNSAPSHLVCWLIECELARRPILIASPAESDYSAAAGWRVKMITKAGRPKVQQCCDDVRREV